MMKFTYTYFIEPRYKMNKNVRSCLLYDLLNAYLSPSKCVCFNENVHCCHGCGHDVPCSCRKEYVTCGHNIIYDDIIHIILLKTIEIKVTFRLLYC